jgi:MFS family permease
LVNGFALFGFIFFNGLYFQQVLGYSPAQAGLRLLPNTLTVMVAAPLAGRLAGRFGYRLPVVLGTVIAGSAMLLLARIGTETPYANLWWKLTLFGVGLGLVNSPVVAAAQAALPPERSGTASGMVNSARQTGGLLGIALLGAIVTAVGGGHGDGFVAGLRTGYLLTALCLFAGTAAAAVLLRADHD